ARTLDSTEQAIRDAVSTWTAGRYSASVTRGTDSREGVSGWITVKWPTDSNGIACGQADVAREGGEIQLFYRSGGVCRCPGGPEIRPRTVRHEVGHAMGFWHTDNVSDVMSTGLYNGCDQQPSVRERYHAQIAYSRPVGNADPDADPTGTVN